MKKYIHLHEVKEKAREYALQKKGSLNWQNEAIAKNIDKAIEVLIKNNLYYNTRLDTMKDSHGKRQEPVGEPTQYKDINDVCRYVFSPYIRNEAYRIHYFEQENKTYFY